MKGYKLDSCFSSKDDYVLSCSEDGFVYCWDLVEVSIWEGLRHCFFNITYVNDWLWYIYCLCMCVCCTFIFIDNMNSWWDVCMVNMMMTCLFRVCRDKLCTISSLSWVIRLIFLVQGLAFWHEPAHLSLESLESPETLHSFKTPCAGCSKAAPEHHRVSTCDIQQLSLFPLCLPGFSVLEAARGKRCRPVSVLPPNRVLPTYSNGGTRPGVGFGTRRDWITHNPWKRQLLTLTLAQCLHQGPIGLACWHYYY